jgi:multidrug resistance efflux pump
MSLALEYPRWQEPLLQALLELDPKEFRVKVENAEELIATRIEELASAEDRQREFRLLHDGLSLIRQLKEGAA